VTWKKYLPKSQGFCRIKKTEFLILDKVELRGCLRSMVLNQLILDPPKSPANLGDFARLFAPLGKGGWGDLNDFG
jgi:hypothetical protein